MQWTVGQAVNMYQSDLTPVDSEMALFMWRATGAYLRLLCLLGAKVSQKEHNCRMEVCGAAASISSLGPTVMTVMDGLQ